LVHTAAVTGRKRFSNHAVEAMARRKADYLIRAIENAQVPISAGYGKDGVIELIRRQVSVHYP
jgi:hypothetical protein